MMRALIGLALLVALPVAGAGCRTAHAQETGVFRSVMIESHPKGWGYAHKTVTQDGVVTGAHMSGGPDAVRLYESKDRLTRKDMNRLKVLIAALRDAPARRGGNTPNQKVEGYISVTIELANGKTITVHTDWHYRFESRNLQAIWDLVHKYQVGAW